MNEATERESSLFGAGEVRRLRLSLGCSQEEFCKIMGVTVATLSRWENGKAEPRGRNVQLLAFLASKLEGGTPASDLKKALLLGGALLATGISPVALLQSGFLTEETLVRELRKVMAPLQEAGESRKKTGDEERPPAERKEILSKKRGDLR
jgi:transcriptional regulator with XRE-family HTH domain